MHPVCKPIHSDPLQVSDIYQIYWKESGNLDGLPTILLYDGLDVSASPVCRGSFNPGVLRTVVIDQRGCGCPPSYACTDDNITWDLVADVKKVREVLDTRKWLVFGSSWSSALLLAYAETHPERVVGLVLRGISLRRLSETAWLDEAGGVSQIYPTQWQEFLVLVAEEECGGLIAAHHEMLFDEDKAGHLKAVKAQADWGSCLICLEPQDVDEDAY